MNYREHPVPVALGGIVETIWTLEACADPAGAEPQPVVPDGRAEIIVHLGDAFERVDDGRSTRQSRILFAGQIERPLLLRPTGRTAVMGVRLLPAACAAVTRVPQHELTGRTEPLADVAPELASWLSSVGERASDINAAAALVASGLARHLDPVRIDNRVAFAAGLIDRVGTALTVDAVGARVNLTRRQLERLFRGQVGLSPKRLMRIRRLQRALSVLQSGEAAPPGATAALAGGYADQAHFVRDCRELAGYTPGGYLIGRAEMTGLFVDRRR
jgi:AraC-like DNA-binding protein